MGYQDLNLHLNMFMGHKNAIDSPKDSTGLLLCKNKKVIDVWGEVGDGKLM